MRHNGEPDAGDHFVDQLGAFLDDELSPEDAAAVSAHLLDCARCRADFALQRALRDRLDRVPLVRAPRRLRDAVEDTIDAATGSAESARGVADVRRLPRHAGAVARAWPWLGWGVAASLAVALVLFKPGAAPDTSPRRAAAASIPMVEAVLADYRSNAGRELPFKYAPERIDALSEALALPIPRLASQRVRMLGAWRVEVGGEPAAAVAYRLGDDVIIQYVVSEALFFRQPMVRDAVARVGRFVTSDGGQGVVAVPAPGSGSLLVGDMPPERLEQLIL